MKLKINGHDIELVYSFRSAIYFEQIAGKNIDFSNFNSNDVITLYYCVALASLQKAKEPVITMLDFLDTIDDNGGEKCLVDFSNWYVDIMKAQYEALESTMNETEKNEKPKGKKKTA